MSGFRVPEAIAGSPDQQFRRRQVFRAEPTVARDRPATVKLKT